MDDFTKEIMTDDEIDGILLADFDLMVSRSSDDAMLLQMIEQNFSQAVAAGTADMGDLISVFKTESVQDAARILKKRREEQQARQEQQQQEVNKIKQQEIQQKAQAHQELMALEMKKLELDKYRYDLDAQTRLQIATINTYARREEIDLNNNQIPDPIELEKVYQKDREVDAKRMDKELEVTTKFNIEQQKLALEREKLQNAREIERLKSETAKEVERMKLRNPVAGERIKK